ncbi:MAG TPA: hypothetical protein VHI13_07130 [Candidatus Kapabacteria bacterium]|nr:hypothetical protein [Candidatus Kapabacteria bacterium]
MNIAALRLFLAALAVVPLIAGCSSEGSTVVDPNADKRAQISLFAVNRSDTGELVRYSELTETFDRNELQRANGMPLDGPIDAIYNFETKLYLHQRDQGMIRVVDLQTRKLLGTVAGFPTKADGRMCSMAFSNASQAWVVCQGSKNLYQVDLHANVISDTIPLPADPTFVGTIGTHVFVCMQLPDSTGQIGIMESNSGGVFTINKTLSVSSPVIFASPSTYATDYFFLTSGTGSGTPAKMYYLNLETLDMLYDLELGIVPLVNYIGMEPTYAAYTRTENLYLALPSAVVQIPFGGYPADWIPGYYPVLAADPYSDLVYAASPDSLQVKRRAYDGTDLPDLTAPASIRSIFFLGVNRGE